MFGRGRCFLLHPLGDLGEVAGVAEVLVDACEAYVGDMIERFEAGHDGFTDLGRTDFVAECLHLPLHATDQTIDPRGIDVALAAGMSDRPGQLVAIERLALAVFLDHCEVAQLDSLECGEARTARLALAAAANCGAVLAWPAVLNLAVFVRAEWAAHSLALIDREARAKLAHALVHVALDASVVVGPVLGEAVQNVGDHVGDVPELMLAEAPRGA